MNVGKLFWCWIVGHKREQEFIHYLPPSNPTQFLLGGYQAYHERYGTTIFGMRCVRCGRLKQERIVGQVAGQGDAKELHELRKMAGL